MPEDTDRRPIEHSFPIDHVNEIADKEAHAKRYYRPVYTMHKWWARRLGSVFRTIVLYALADEDITVPGTRQSTFGADDGLPEIDWENPDALWEYYLEDVDLGDKTVLDPFMGGGTSIVESLRLGCNAIGSELNPVAWFIVKKEVEAVELAALDAAFETIEDRVGEEIREYYQTESPHCAETADVMYNFWVKQLPCRHCNRAVPLFKDYRLGTARASADHATHVLCPSCWAVFETDDDTTETDCPACDRSFVPSTAGNVSGRTYTCPHCEEHPEMNIIDRIEQAGPPDTELVAVEYYCQTTGTRGYKAATEFDRKLARDAAAELAEIESTLPLPTQDRYRGSSDRARNHGYETYRDMFNDRQLLCLGKLLQEIEQIDDQTVTEFLLLAFSDALAFNNMFCEYHTDANKIQGIYKRHTITARHQPVENNVWGTEQGTGTFSNTFQKMRAGKEYCQSPYEKYVEDGATKQKDGVGAITGQLVDDVSDLGTDGNVFLRCGSSESLPIADNSVDAVITDPPYFDNVMYAETADFYYVWLRQVLADTYDQFTPDLTPKANEVVSDPVGEASVAVHRDDDHFVAGLTAVFEQAQRVLTDDGIMVFTFHHTETDGWKTVLTAVLEAGFAITALYPIRGEMQGSTHIHNKATIEYDMIIVCRTRETDANEIRWQSLEDDIATRASDEIARLEADGSWLSRGDIFAVTMGTCLERFSTYYPNVTHDGDPLSVATAIDRIREIVDEQLMADRVQRLSDDLDTISAVYLTYVLGRGETIAAPTLAADLRQRSVDVADFVDHGLLDRAGDKLTVLDPLDRVQPITEKQSPLAIDKAHYLSVLFETDRLAQEFAAWTDAEAIATLRHIAVIENDDTYATIADTVDGRSDVQLGIDEFT